MSADDLIIPVAVCVVVGILLAYFIVMKGPMRKLTISNPDGSKADVSVEIADNPVTRAKGLMGRDALPADEGMLFIFDQPGVHQFWMLNTSIPLDAIFMDEDGNVVDVVQMEPCGLLPSNCPRYAPKAPALFVLEVNQGFSIRHGVVVGSRASP